MGALGAMLAGVAALVTPAALIGALASTLIVFGLARTGAERAPWTTTRLLLTGVVVAAGWGAVIALLLTLAPDVQVKGMLFWLIGDLGGTTVAAPALVTLAIALLASLACARTSTFCRAARRWPRRSVLRWDAPRSCSAPSRRSQRPQRSPARERGVRRPRRSPRSSPCHRQRSTALAGGASVLCGGTLLVFADTLARTIVAPIQLPVGVITALVGVPVLLVLLTRIRS